MSESTLVRPAPVLAATTLAWREIVRFYRQRNRITGALLQPAVFWLLLGFGFSGTFQASPGDPTGYLEYAFPGIVILTLLFTAIFSTISIIEDRREGFLQSVLVAPVPRSSIVLGKVLGGTAIAWFQGLIYLALAPTVDIHPGFAQVVGAAVVLMLVAFALTALGFTIAWSMESTQGFHAIMNVFLIPLWLLSGAFFPGEQVPTALRVVMAANPLTYGLAAFRRILYGQFDVADAPLPGLTLALIVTVLFALVMFVLATTVARRTK